MTDQPAPGGDSALSSSQRAVFISYASQDSGAATRICERLRAAGIEVWFDQSALRGGDAWDAAIRRQIKACALFIAVISRNTHDRDEGYFRLEWKLAVDRSHLMSADRAFLLPVVVDDTDESDERVPDRFREVQWTALPGGETTPAFVERVARLLATDVAAGAAEAASRGAPARAVAARQAGRATRSRLAFTPARLLSVALAVLVVVAVAYLASELGRPRPSPEGARPAAGGAGAANDKSIAVLPFVDMSERHDQEYFSDGLAEELIDLLVKIPELRVPARTSSFAFKGKSATVPEIARALGVSHVLEGSVRKAGDRLRITAQLIRVDSGMHLWSQSYDRDVHDVFAVQDDIAKAVVDHLRVTLLGSGRMTTAQPINVEAHNLFLQARYEMERQTPQSLDAAVALFHKALDVDPNYAAAWAWLSYCHTRRVGEGMDTTGPGYAKATEAAERAIALDPASTEAYVALATARMQYHLDWASAADALAKAQAIDPNNSLLLQVSAHHAQATGRLSDATATFRRAAEVDPLNMVPVKYLAKALFYAGRLPEAEAVLRGGLRLNPEFPSLNYELGVTLLLAGHAQDALAAVMAEPAESWRSFGVPLALHALHRDQEAEAALGGLLATSAGAEFQVAEAYAYLGQADKAFEWLEQARTRHDPGLMWVRRDPLLASIFSDRRYPAFLQRIRLTLPPNGD